MPEANNLNDLEEKGRATAPLSYPHRRSLWQQSMSCTCPRCGDSPLFNKGVFDLSVKGTCPVCELDLSKSDSADGPAVFLIFILGFLLVPLALWADALWELPLWAHAALWGVLAIGITVGSLKPIKSCVLALQYRHRASEWIKDQQDGL
ncbi:MAG: DUF983 domain-containing protein [Pseudobdellovibrionaceae bacterium]|nr:DUF983 domain-containing protein [Pseudobdellovibrionaceae bacterium]